MGRREKPGTEELKVTFEAIMGRQGSQELFGIEDAADEVVRHSKLRYMAERITAYDRGDDGGRRRCPLWPVAKG